MDHFTSVDTLNVSNFLRGTITPTGSGTGTGEVNFLQPVTGLESNGKQVIPAGFGKDYDLFLTINATTTNSLPGGAATSFSTMNAILWADPLNNDGTPGVSEFSDPAFSNGIRNDIVLATGTMVSASMKFDPATMLRSADFVLSLTPTLEGSLLSDGSLRQGSLLEEKLTTPPTAFNLYPQPDGGVIDTVTDGSGTVTLSNPDGSAADFMIPDINSRTCGLAMGFSSSAVSTGMDPISLINGSRTRDGGLPRVLGSPRHAGIFRSFFDLGERVAWIFRLVKIGAEGEGRSVDVTEINRPDDLGNMGLRHDPFKFLR